MYLYLIYSTYKDNRGNHFLELDTKLYKNKPPTPPKNYSVRRRDKGNCFLVERYSIRLKEYPNDLSVSQRFRLERHRYLGTKNAENV